MEKSDIDAIEILEAAQKEIIHQEANPYTRLSWYNRLSRVKRYLRNGHVHHTKNRTYRSNRKEVG